MNTNTVDLNYIIEKFPAAPDYLIHIYLICRDDGQASNAKISAWMHVSKPAVSQAVNRLRDAGLVEQDHYSTVKLTETGIMMAEKLLKRHYLIEHLLVNKLDFPWDLADEEAARLQSSISDDFCEHLWHYFNEPATCPHGNPFPSTLKAGYDLNAPDLTKISGTQIVEITRITEEGEGIEGLLKFCHVHRIHPGAVFKVYNLSQSQTAIFLAPLDSESSQEFVLSGHFAKHIRWKKTA